MKKLSIGQAATLECGARWCINILVELGGNYATKLSAYRRDKLKLAIASLHCVLHGEDQG